jgi:hypothetical protein
VSFTTLAARVFHVPEVTTVEMLWIVGALVVLAVLALAFGADSRDGFGDDAARWETWRASAAHRRGRLASAFAATPLEFELQVRPAEFEAFAAGQRLAGPRLRLPRPVLPSPRPALYWLGTALLRVGAWLQEVARPAPIGLGGPV